MIEPQIENLVVRQGAPFAISIEYVDAFGVSLFDTLNHQIKMQIRASQDKNSALHLDATSHFSGPHGFIPSSVTRALNFDTGFYTIEVWDSVGCVDRLAQGVIKLDKTVIP